jgi:hypothetical protein
LLPSDWAALYPLKLANQFSAEHCPLAWADGDVGSSSLNDRIGG